MVVQTHYALKIAIACYNANGHLIDEWSTGEVVVQE